MQRIRVIARHNTVLLLGDPGPLVAWIITPLLLMAVIKPAMETLLVQQGFIGANGSEQVVPAFTVMFAFFWMQFIGRNFFSEHGWGTWERILATDATPAEVLIGKLLPPFVLILIQQAILFIAGAIIFDMDANGAVWAYSIVTVAIVLCVLTLTLMLVALTRTLTQMDALATGLTMLFATLGGVLVPTFALPNWAENIAPATPNYWAMKTSQELILDDKGFSAVIGPTFVLLLFAGAFALVAAFSFSFTDAKSVEV